MRRPGFAVIEYDKETRATRVVESSVVDNKSTKALRTHGQMLLATAAELRRYFEKYKDRKLILAKEDAVMSYRNINTSVTISKVHGVADMIAAEYGYFDFQGIGTTAIKKMLTGRGDAQKDEVERGTRVFIGHEYEYQFDDESDAVAVGLAWLIQGGLLKMPKNWKLPEKENG